MHKRYFKAAGMLCIILLLPACGISDNKTPEDWFDYTWSGVGKSNSLSFRGNAAVMRGEKMKMEESINFTGQLKDHQQLVIRTVLPSTIAKNAPRATTAQPEAIYETDLSWKGGNWSLESDEADAFMMGIARLNPLGQMEEIHDANKKITADRGAPRGTKVLRIELDPTWAKQRIKTRLIGEMEGVRRGWQAQITDFSKEQRSKLQSELENEWALGKDRLVMMLNNSEVNVFYHLTIDRNTGRPTRLTSETELVYTNMAGEREQEILLTDSRFDKDR